MPSRRNRPGKSGSALTPKELKYLREVFRDPSDYACLWEEDPKYQRVSYITRHALGMMERHTTTAEPLKGMITKGFVQKGVRLVNQYGEVYWRVNLTEAGRSALTVHV